MVLAMVSHGMWLGKDYHFTGKVVTVFRPKTDHPQSCQSSLSSLWGCFVKQGNITVNLDDSCLVLSLPRAQNWSHFPTSAPLVRKQNQKL